MSGYCSARSIICWSSSSRNFGFIVGVVLPALPRFGITKACITVRFDRARSFTVWTVFAASASGSGLFVSGDVGTQESTVAVVAESRNSSLR